LNGRSNRNNYVNIFYFQSDFAHNSTSMIANANTLTSRVKTYALDNLHFMNTSIKPLFNTDGTPAQGRAKTIDQVGTGARAVGIKPLANEQIALIVRRNMTDGINGEIRLRGFLLAEDMTPFTGRSGSLALPATFTGLANELNALWTSATLVLPDSASFDGAGSRIIVSHALAGVRYFQLGRIRQSIEVDEAKLAQRKINRFNQSIEKLYEASGGQGLLGQLLATAKGIAQAALAFYNALDIITRGKISIPSALASILALLV
jgi:hypothetical protein